MPVFLLRTVLAVCFVLLSSAVAQAQDIVIDFEGIAPPSGTAPLGATYDPLGVFFNPTDQEVCAGLSAGDPGNWDLEGTNGPAFLGFSTNFLMEVTLSAPYTTLTLDASRSNGSQSGDQLTVSIYSGASLLDSTTITFGAINSWTTVTLTDAGGFDRVTWEGLVFPHPFGVDNLTFDGVIPVELVTFTVE